MARIHRRPTIVLGFVVTLMALGCEGDRPASPALPGGIDPWQVVLAPQGGDSALDRDIAASQGLLRRDRSDVAQLDRLGQLLDVKARATADAGLYPLVLQCARCLDELDPGSPAAMLLRGHALHSMHRFEEAADVAHRLVAARGSMHDFGLLGDVLVDLGDLDGAQAAYQRMLDLRPCLQSYVRSAHLAWLRGDLDAAQELMALATAAGSPRDPSALAWAHARMALYELAAGKLETAGLDCQVALKWMPSSASAHLAYARLLDAQGDVAAAVEQARAAADADPLPEFEWALADWLRATGDDAGAERVERALASSGARDDPRTFAVYLATRGHDGELALQLAEQELTRRQDLYTLDAKAWALHACGRSGEAASLMQDALRAGTRDPRLWLHAGAIAAARGDAQAAKSWLLRADAMQCLLLPGERALLRELLSTV